MDLLLEENGNGGEFVKTPRDLAVIEGLQNMVYLSLFGGNTKASTPQDRLSNVEDLSYWGNFFLERNEQFNSETEKALKSNALTSAGRINIAQAIDVDLKWMSEFAEITRSVSIIESDRIKIQIQIKQPGNLEDKSFIFLWDATKEELTTE